MGYWEDYNKERMGIPTGKIWSLGAQQARDEKRWFEERQNHHMKIKKMNIKISRISIK